MICKATKEYIVEILRMGVKKTVVNTLLTTVFLYMQLKTRLWRDFYAAIKIHENPAYYANFSFFPPSQQQIQ